MARSLQLTHTHTHIHKHTQVISDLNRYGALKPAYVELLKHYGTPEGFAQRLLSGGPAEAPHVQHLTVTHFQIMARARAIAQVG